MKPLGALSRLTYTHFGSFSYSYRGASQSTIIMGVEVN